MINRNQVLYTEAMYFWNWVRQQGERRGKQHDKSWEDRDEELETAVY